jgi:hypothetical protein
MRRQRGYIAISARFKSIAQNAYFAWNWESPITFCVTEAKQDWLGWVATTRWQSPVSG